MIANCIIEKENMEDIVEKFLTQKVWLHIQLRTSECC